MVPRSRRVVIATLWAAAAVIAMVMFLRGDWSGYLLPLGLLGVAVFVVALRLEAVHTFASGKWTGSRVLQVSAISCVGLTVLCTASVVGIAKLSGCPVLGDPGGTIVLRNADSVSLVVYPEGVEDPRARKVLAPGEEDPYPYLVSCGRDRHAEQVFRVIGAEYAGSWVYCREVRRGEIDSRPVLSIVRGDLGCLPSFAPAGPP